MPKFALDLLWIHTLYPTNGKRVVVTWPILKYLHQDADKTRIYSAKYPLNSPAI